MTPLVSGAGSVLASLGPDGALLVEDDGATYGRSPVTSPRSTVGAGDAMLAGFLAAGGLCRTEHMFMAEERLPVVREMIMARDEEGRSRGRHLAGESDAQPDALATGRRAPAHSDRPDPAPDHALTNPWSEP